MSWHAELVAPMDAHRQLAVTVDGGPGVTAVTGPNGSGKTTLLRVLAGVHPVHSAMVRLGERVVHDTARGRCMPPEQRRVGYVPQGYGLFPHLDVVDNVAFGLSTGAGALARGERRARAEAVLTELGVGSLASRRVHGLSGGEAQRVALARALVTDPAMLLLDEPLAALDARQRREVRTFLAERLGNLGCPTVLVTHDLRDLTELDATVVVLEDGRVVQQGTPDELAAAPATAFVSELAR